MVTCRSGAEAGGMLGGNKTKGPRQQGSQDRLHASMLVPDCRVERGRTVGDKKKEQERSLSHFLSKPEMMTPEVAAKKPRTNERERECCTSVRKRQPQTEEKHSEIQPWRNRLSRGEKGGKNPRRKHKNTPKSSRWAGRNCSTSGHSRRS